MGAAYADKRCENQERNYVRALVADLLCIEELPANARGFGFGVLGMNIALGTGVAAIVYGGLFEPLGVSWRWLYVVGVPPLLLVAVLRRRLGESKRFEAARAGWRLVDSWRRILAPQYRHWLVLVVAVVFLLQLTQQAQTFALDFLQTDPVPTYMPLRRAAG